VLAWRRELGARQAIVASMVICEAPGVVESGLVRGMAGALPLTACSRVCSMR